MGDVATVLLCVLVFFLKTMGCLGIDDESIEGYQINSNRFNRLSDKESGREW